MEKVDYKKKFKELYLPKTKPAKVCVPKIQYIIIDGKGNPNYEEGEYSKAVGILYALSYRIKMSKMGSRNIDGYFDYVVPPLEGLCVQCMHIGEFDNEPETVSKIDNFIKENGLQNDIGIGRKHHEIYLSDPRKCNRTKMKTVLRIPIKKI